MVGKKLESANVEIMEQLRKAVNDATDRGDYLPAAIYIFQMLEGTLRMHINWLAREKNVSEENIKRISEDEIVFPRLVLYFDVLRPDNGLSERLLNLNKKRNSIIHRLFFDFESLDSLKEFLEGFCQEGIELYKLLGGLDKYQK